MKTYIKLIIAGSVLLTIIAIVVAVILLSKKSGTCCTWNCPPNNNINGKCTKCCGNVIGVYTTEDACKKALNAKHCISPS